MTTLDRKFKIQLKNKYDSKDKHIFTINVTFHYFTVSVSLFCLYHQLYHRIIALSLI